MSPFRLAEADMTRTIEQILTDGPARKAADLVWVGTELFQELAQNDGLPFAEWTRRMRATFARRAVKLADSDLEWCRGAVLAIPEIKEQLVDYKERLNRWLLRNPVLPQGAKLVFFAPHTIAFETAESSKCKHQPAATVTLIGPLSFHAKRLDSLELDDVHVLMTLTPAQMPGGKLLSLQAAAGGFRVSPELITSRDDGGVEIQLESINKALASLFANLNDKSPHNNRSAYLHVAWLDGDTYISLEKIRSDFEQGNWQCPQLLERSARAQRSLFSTTYP